MPSRWHMVVASSAAAAVAIYVLHRRRRAASAIAPKRSWAHGVEVRPSRVAGAGDGLYASRDFAAGEELGEYYGRVLSLLEALNLVDRDYLMGGFGINAHVDAKFALDCPARYVNDHFDVSMLNARFEKNKSTRRAKLVATRAIRKGEEVYSSYGETYWRARGIDAATGLPLPPEERSSRSSSPRAS